MFDYLALSLSLSLFLPPSVNVHLQYEARRRALAQLGIGSVSTVNVGSMQAFSFGRPKRPVYLRYHHFVFSDCQPEAMRLFWAQLVCTLRVGTPVFVAIDDDLAAPNAQCVRWQRGLFHSFMQSMWPDPAPWELPDRVASLHEEAHRGLQAPSPAPPYVFMDDMQSLLRAGRLTCFCEQDQYRVNAARETWAC